MSSKSSEREETFVRLSILPNVLVVAVRVDHSLDAGVEFSDGLLTSRGSFQKLYSQSEFRDYVAQVLGRRPHMAGLGVAYVFRDELVESSYLVSLAQKRVETSREQAIEQFTQDAAAKRYIELSAALGRAPIAAEFSGYPDLQERFGSLGRIDRLARHALSVEAIEESRRRRRGHPHLYGYGAIAESKGSSISVVASGFAGRHQNAVAIVFSGSSGRK